MIIIDILVAGFCANALSSKKNIRKDFGRRHMLISHNNKSTVR